MSYYDEYEDVRTTQRKRTVSDIPSDESPKQMQRDADPEIGFPIQEAARDPMPMAESVAKADTSPRSTRYVRDYGRSQKKSAYGDTTVHKKKAAPRVPQPQRVRSTAPVTSQPRTTTKSDWATTPKPAISREFQGPRRKAAQPKSDWATMPKTSSHQINLSEKQRIVKRGKFGDTMTGKLMLESDRLEKKKGLANVAGALGAEFTAGTVASGESIVRGQAPDLWSLGGGLARRAIIKGRKYNPHWMIPERGAEAAVQSRSVGFGKGKAFGPAFIAGGLAGEIAIGFGIGKTVAKVGRVVTKTKVTRISKKGRTATGKGRTATGKKAGVKKPSPMKRDIGKKSQAELRRIFLGGKDKAGRFPTKLERRAAFKILKKTKPKTKPKTTLRQPKTIKIKAKPKPITRTQIIKRTPKKYPIKRIPKTPIKRVPKYPIKKVPKYPIKKVPKTPIKRVPKTPIKRVPKTPIKKVPKYPIKKVPKYPIKKVPKTPIKKVPKPPLTIPKKIGLIGLTTLPFLRRKGKAQISGGGGGGKGGSKRRSKRRVRKNPLAFKVTI